MKMRIAVPCLVVLASVALGQDAGKPPAGGKPAAPAKKERQATPEAEAAIKKFASLLVFPSHSYKNLEMSSHCDVQLLGGEVGCKFVVKDDGTVDIEIAVPEEALRQGGANPREIKNVAKKMVGGIFRPFFVPPDVVAKQYDLSSKTENGKTVVEMKRFADDAAWDKATLWLNADGLVEKQVGTLNIDPNDMMGAMDAGVEIETTFEYKKRGERFTIESEKISHPLTGESSAKITYFEIPGTQPLPKQIDFSHPVYGDLSIAVHDFVLDGKKVAGTERKDEPKPAAPTPPAPGKPATPPEKK